MQTGRLRVYFLLAVKILPVIVLVVALGLLAHHLKNLEWETFKTDLLSRPSSQIFSTILLVIANYLVFVLYDLFSLRQSRHTVPLIVSLRTAFVSFALTNSVGQSIVTGLGPRFRDYSKFGLTLSNVAVLLLFNLEIWWLGFFTTLGLSFLIHPLDGIIPGWSYSISRLLGLFLLSLVSSYLYGCWAWSGREIRLFRKTVKLPTLKTGLQKILIGTLDVSLVALTLYNLMPQSLNIEFMHFVSLYLAAHLVGVISMVPGGLGVLEGILLNFLEPFGPTGPVLASILLFRIFHYLLPMTLAALLEFQNLFRRSRA